MAKLSTALIAAGLVTACSSSSTIAAPKTWFEVEQYTPIQQRQFCDLANEYRSNLSEAFISRNEIKQNKVKQQRQEDLDGLLPEGKFDNWIARVVSVKQVNDQTDPSVDGDVAVVVELKCDVQVGSGQLVVGDSLKWGATIDYNSREYREASKLSSGDFVIVSGEFVTIKDFQPGKKETYYASRPLDSSDLDSSSNKKYGNGEELFLANIKYFASAR